jgi:inosine-uridine nucleoside N-ribohydrolase
MRRLAVGLLALPALWAARETVLLDTDSGHFGEDGAALVMLIRSPSHVSLAGVTMVPGNVWPRQGAEYTLHILDLLGQPRIAVYTGAGTPLLHTPAMARQAAQRLGKIQYSGAFDEDPAELRPAAGPSLTGRKPLHGGIPFLVSEIERQPGEVTLLAIGPMTNIALALRLAPEIENKIKRIVFMGGNLRAGGNASSSAEFNFWFDPEAARIVLRSHIREKIMFPLDICNQAPVRKNEFDQIVAVRTPITELFREDLGNGYPGFLKNPAAKSYLWDSLAAAYLIDPDFVTKSEAQYLDVETNWGKSYGATIPLDRRQAPDATPVKVMLQLDFHRVWNLYKDLLTRSP